ncbi:MAG: hypothetical protein JWR61_3407 [Ferruginibacter sp.]|nr:hypothetical protein [Ferruginibacter sp.]
MPSAETRLRSVRFADWQPAILQHDFFRSESPAPKFPRRVSAQVAEVRNQHQLQDSLTNSVKYTHYTMTVQNNLKVPS